MGQPGHEWAELIDQLRSVIGPYLDDARSADRQRVLLDAILVPDLAVPSARGAARRNRGKRLDAVGQDGARSLVEAADG